MIKTVFRNKIVLLHYDQWDGIVTLTGKTEGYGIVTIKTPQKLKYPKLNKFSAIQRAFEKGCHGTNSKRQLKRRHRRRVVTNN